jgi:hypothetical protein
MATLRHFLLNHLKFKILIYNLGTFSFCVAVIVIIIFIITIIIFDELK